MPKDDQPEDSGPPEEVQPASEADDTDMVREQLDEALREKEQFRAMAQRAQADLINYRRRAEEERYEVRRTANSELLLKILSIVDDFDRGIGLVPEDAVAPGWLDGLSLVHRNLYQFLDSEGVTKISAEGQPFEPWQHEAVFYEETPEGREGMVVKVIREGYKLHDRVLRAAQVGVSKAPEQEERSETTRQEG